MTTTYNDWWTEQRDRMKARGRNGLDTLVTLICWELWKNWNAWVFGDARRQFRVERLANVILDELQLWIMAGRGTDIFVREGEGVGVNNMRV
jgi:hypothetical protein